MSILDGDNIKEICSAFLVKLSLFLYKNMLFCLFLVVVLIINIALNVNFEKIGIKWC